MPSSVNMSVAGSSAGTTWSSAISSSYRNPSGVLQVSVEASSDWEGIVTVQRKLPGMTAYEDVYEKRYQGDSQDEIQDMTRGVLYRIGVKDADYVVGDVTARLVKASQR